LKGLFGKPTNAHRLAHAQGLHKLLAKVGQDIVDGETPEAPECFRVAQDWAFWLARLGEWSLSDFQNGIEAAKRKATCAAHAASRQATKDFSSWIQLQVIKGMQAIHTLTREVPEGPNSAGPYEFFFYTDPKQMIVARAEPWFARWNRDRYQVENQTLGQALEALETRARDEEP
jgi:hypothetical protein